MPFHGYHDSGLLTEHGMRHVIDCVAAMKEVTVDKVGLALDCGPGWTLPDAIRFARAVEPHNLLWLEDMLTGDYILYVTRNRPIEMASQNRRVPGSQSESRVREPAGRQDRSTDAAASSG